MFVVPITRQTYDYATPIACDNNPRNIIDLYPVSDDQDFYNLEPEPIKGKPPLMFTPSQIKTTIRPNTLTAQDAGKYSYAELDQNWNRILFSEHSDSTHQLLEKARSCSFTSSNTPDYEANSPHDNPYSTLRIGLHDKFLNLTPLFTPTWFYVMLSFHYSDIISMIYITTLWNIFLYIPFCTSYYHSHHKLYKTISIKYILKQNITIFSSIAHGFLFILTAEMVNDLEDTHHKRPKLAINNFKSPPLAHITYNQINDQTNNSTNPSAITSPPPFYTECPNRQKDTL